MTAAPARTGHAPRPTTTRPPAWPRAVPWALAAAAIGCQIAFPLTGGGTPALTIATVVVFAAAVVAHVAVSRGAGAAVALLAIAGGGGLAAEAIGVRTGFPFGEYAYAETLGPQVLGVPVVVPLAWTMMAWPALVVARRLVPSTLIGPRHGAQPEARPDARPGAQPDAQPDERADARPEAQPDARPGLWAFGARRRARWVARVGVGAWALATWDVFLDPQMIDAGHWAWARPEPGLPGVAGVPLTNYAGWLLVSLLIVAALDAALPETRADARSGARPGARPDVPPGARPDVPPGARPDVPPGAGLGARLGARPGAPLGDGVPAALYLWTWFSSVLAAAAFWGRPTVALVGGVLMGLVAAPFAWSLWRARSRS